MLLFLGGLSILAGGGDLLVIAFGEVSGGHFNPAVSLVAYLDRRIAVATKARYWVAQIAGFVVAGLGLLIASDRDAVASTATVPNVEIGSALLLETVLTAVFVVVILAVTMSSQFQSSALRQSP